MSNTGRYKLGREIASRAASRSLELGDPPVEAEALVTRAKLEAHDGDLAAARTTLGAALRAAALAHDDRLQAHALVDLVLRSQARTDEADVIAVVADAAIGRVGDEVAAGDVLIAAVKKAWSRHSSRRSASEHPTLAWALNDVALIQAAQDDRAGARVRFERALHIWERTSGEGHPDVAWPLINLGELSLADGDHATAAALCRRAARVVETARGPEHPELAGALLCVGRALTAHAPDEARDVLTRALRLAPSRDEATLLEIRAALARTSNAR